MYSTDDTGSDSGSLDMALDQAAGHLYFMTQDGASGRERFHISASVVERPVPAAAGESGGADT